MSSSSDHIYTADNECLHVHSLTALEVEVCDKQDMCYMLLYIDERCMIVYYVTIYRGMLHN